jgi:hypothetical protein
MKRLILAMTVVAIFLKSDPGLAQISGIGPPLLRCVGAEAIKVDAASQESYSSQGKLEIQLQPDGNGIFSGRANHVFTFEEDTSSSSKFALELNAKYKAFTNALSVSFKLIENMPASQKVIATWTNEDVKRKELKAITIFEQQMFKVGQAILGAAPTADDSEALTSEAIYNGDLTKVSVQTCTLSFKK